MRRALLAGLALVVAAVATGCGSASQSAPRTRVATTGTRSPGQPVGIVSGWLVIEGGVLEHKTNQKPCACSLQAGTVRFISAHGKRVDVRVGKRGRFTLKLPIGRYTAMAGLRPPMQWPMGSCGLVGGRPQFDSYFDHKTHSYYVVVRRDRRLKVLVACLAL